MVPTRFHSPRVLPHRIIVTGLRAISACTGEAFAFDQPAYKDETQTLMAFTA